MIIEVPGAVVDTRIVDDPLLGPAHVITCGTRSTTMSAIDWQRPTRIPTVAAPAHLAPGAGGALMNLIATRARDAGVAALRYAGRYPTAALFRTLLRSFRTTATEDEFTSHFRLLGDELEVPIDFIPAPHIRIEHRHGFVEKRDGVERAVVDGVSFEIDASPARLAPATSAIPTSALPPSTSAVPTPSAIPTPSISGGEVRRVGVRAEVWFGDALYAHVATFDIDGHLIEGPHPIPKCSSSVIGEAFPAALTTALADLVADAVPAPLADDARRYLTSRTLRWADLGARPAAGDAVHAILWERIAPFGLARLALALAEALGPVVTRTLVREIEGDVAVMSHRA